MNFIDTLSDSLFGGMSGAKQPKLADILSGLLPGAGGGNPIGGFLSALTSGSVGGMGAMSQPGLMGLFGGGDSPKALAAPTLLSGLSDGLIGNGSNAPAPPRAQPTPPQDPTPVRTPPPALANALGDILRKSGAVPASTPTPQGEQLPWSSPSQMNVSPQPATPLASPKITGEDVSTFIKAVMAGTANVDPSRPGISAFAQGASGAIATKDKLRAEAAALKRAEEDRTMKLEDRDFDHGLKASQEKRANAKSKDTLKTAEINNTLALMKAMRGLDGNLTTDQKFKLNDQLYKYADKINKNGGMSPQELDSALAIERQRLMTDYGVKQPSVTGAPKAETKSKPVSAVGEVTGATSAGVGSNPTSSMGEGKSQAAPARPMDKATFDALPPKSWFVNPADGRILQKQ